MDIKLIAVIAGAVLIFAIGAWAGWKLFPLYYRLTKSTAAKVYDELTLSPLDKLFMRPTAALVTGFAALFLAGIIAGELNEKRKADSTKNDAAQGVSNSGIESTTTKDERFPDLALQNAFRQFEKIRSPVSIRKIYFDDMDGDGEKDAVIDFTEKRPRVDEPFSCFVVLKKKEGGMWAPVVDFTYGSGEVELVSKGIISARLTEQKSGVKETRVVKYVLRNGFVETARTDEPVATQRLPQESVSAPVESASVIAPPPMTEQTKSSATMEKSIDDQYSDLKRKECERGLPGLLCRESLKMRLCDGKWVAEPPPGQSLCKMAASQ